MRKRSGQFYRHLIVSWNPCFPLPPHLWPPSMNGAKRRSFACCVRRFSPGDGIRLQFSHIFWIDLPRGSFFSDGPGRWTLPRTDGRKRGSWNGTNTAERCTHADTEGVGSDKRGAGIWQHFRKAKENAILTRVGAFACTPLKCKSPTRRPMWKISRTMKFNPDSPPQPCTIVLRFGGTVVKSLKVPGPSAHVERHRELIPQLKQREGWAIHYIYFSP